MSAYLDNLRVNATSALCPGSSFYYREGVLHMQDGTSAPASNEIEEKLVELKAQDAMKKLRAERDIALAKTDWKVIAAMESGVALDENVVIYRQALRDLPQTMVPSITDDGKLIAEFPNL